MEICFDMGHVFGRKRDDLENSYVLRALLDCLIRVNLAHLKLARRPIPRLYQSGVRYGRTEVWDPIPALYKRKYGDCKSLSAALIAEYLNQGIEANPVFRFNPNSRGGNDFHILVAVPNQDGYEGKVFEDPSKRLGMGRDELAHFY